jgi:predicted RNA-binding protein (virulence factor B family)
MVDIGKSTTLKVVRETENGLYLDGEELGEILMPQKYVTEEIRKTNQAGVFVYTDSEDRLVATTEEPIAEVGEFAKLTVKAISRFGAFLDWGLQKDLLVPFSEQNQKMKEGEEVVVRIYLDEKTNRLAASVKLDKFLNKSNPEYNSGDQVQLLIANKTDLGFKAIVDDEYWGLLYSNQLFKTISIGERISGYVNRVREDGKIDLLLEKPGYDKIDEISESIVRELQNNNGFLAVTDKTSPEIIKSMFGISKKNFKKAVGKLLKNKQITFKADGINLV